jgi:hypothetical protein
MSDVVPLIRHPQPFCQPGGTNTLQLPCEVIDALTPEQLPQFYAIQFKYARDVSLLQSEAYEAIFRLISPDC